MLSMLLGGSHIIHSPRYALTNGYEMPGFALGTFLGFDENGVVKSQNKELFLAVGRAIEIGYRHIATASIYETEAEVGEAINLKIKQQVVRRENVFVTSQLWNTAHRREQVHNAIKESLQKLQLEYIDLYLMHWPIGLNDDYSFNDVDYMETWKGMQEVHLAGMAKSIGVSNFNLKQLKRLMALCTIKPVALQIEVHTQLAQRELVEFCQSENIVVMGYSPLGSLARRSGMDAPRHWIRDPVLLELARKYRKTPAQVVLRWAVDRTIVPIPKSVNSMYIAENINIFDFRLRSDEVEQINQLSTNTRYTLPSFWQDHPHYPFDKVEKPIPDPFKPAPAAESEPEPMVIS